MTDFFFKFLFHVLVKFGLLSCMHLILFFSSYLLCCIKLSGWPLRASEILGLMFSIYEFLGGRHKSTHNSEFDGLPQCSVHCFYQIPHTGVTEGSRIPGPSAVVDCWCLLFNEGPVVRGRRGCRWQMCFSVSFKQILFAWDKQRGFLWFSGPLFTAGTFSFIWNSLLGKYVSCSSTHPIQTHPCVGKESWLCTNVLLFLLAISFDFCVGVSSRPEQISCFLPRWRWLWLVISEWNWEEVAGSLYPLSMASNLCLELGSGRYPVPLPSSDSFSFCSSHQ